MKNLILALTLLLALPAAGWGETYYVIAYESGSNFLCYNTSGWPESDCSGVGDTGVADLDTLDDNAADSDVFIFSGGPVGGSITYGCDETDAVDCEYLTNHSGLTIRGCLSTDTDYASHGGDVIWDHGGDNDEYHFYIVDPITIQNMSFTNGSTSEHLVWLNPPSSAATISDVTFFNSPKGLRAANTSDYNIENCHLYDLGIGINIEDPVSIEINHTLIHDISTQAISASSASRESDIDINNSLIFNSVAAIYNNSGDAINASNCAFFGNGSSSALEFIEVSGNIVTNNSLILGGGFELAYYGTHSGSQSGTLTKNAADASFATNITGAQIINTTDGVWGYVTNYNTTTVTATTESGDSFVWDDGDKYVVTLAKGTGVISHNNPIRSAPNFFDSRRYAAIVINVDDWANWDYFKSLSAKLDTYGWNGVFGLNRTFMAGDIDSEDWTELASYATAGDELAVHGNIVSTNIVVLDGMTPNYSNGAHTATYTFTDTKNNATGAAGADGYVDTLTLDSTDNNDDHTIDLTAVTGCNSSSCRRFENLCPEIDSLTNYSCSYNSDDAEIAYYVAVDATGNVDGTLISCSQERVLAGEVNDPQAAIAANITGYTATSWIPPGNANDGDITKAAMKENFFDNGYTAARGRADTNWELYAASGFDIFDYDFGLTGATIFGDAEPDDSWIETKIAELCERLSATGGVFVIYAHNTDSLTLTKWDKVLAEIAKSNVPVKTYKEVYADLTAGGWVVNDSDCTSYSSDCHTYTQGTIDMSIDSADFTLQPSSPCIDAGTYISATVNPTLNKCAAGAGIVDIGAEEASCGDLMTSGAIQ
jgi:hypothetical protein